MPNRYGFDELPCRGNIERRCVWCGERAPSRSSESHMARHARRHRKQALAAAEESKREVTLAQTAIVV